MGRMLTLIIYPNHEQNTKEVDQHHIPSGITEGCLGAQWGGGGGGHALGPLTKMTKNVLLVHWANWSEPQL